MWTNVVPCLEAKGHFASSCILKKTAAAQQIALNG
jgi:hypothetical protein